MKKKSDKTSLLCIQAVIGQGVDRHLFGLKMIAQSEGMELPQLYKDVGYTRSTYFTLTTSQVIERYLESVGLTE